MGRGEDKGIHVPAAVRAHLALLVAGPGLAATELRRVLVDGAVAPVIGRVAFAQSADPAKGPVLLVVEGVRRVAALVRPYDAHRLALRTRQGRPVDERGPLAGPGLDEWFVGEPEAEVLDVFNTEVLAVADLGRPGSDR